MIHRELGKTGLMVSNIALGTVSLGLDYGIEAPEQFGRPSQADSLRLLGQAATAGINLFDTAPTYGSSEQLVGQALRSFPECYVATKVSIPKDEAGHLLHGARVREAVERSLENSLRSLQRDTLEIVQIHNATVDVLRLGEVTEALLEARSRGKIRFLGVSVYEEEAARTAIKAGCFDVLQIPYSVLDQRMAARVFAAAVAAGVGILARSALLKGALTAKAQWLPAELAPLRRAAEKAKNALAADWQSLPLQALRFCLSAPEVTTVLVGARTTDELLQGLTAAELGPLDPEVLPTGPSLALHEENLLNPSYWPIA